MRRPFKLPFISAPCSSGCWYVCVRVCYICAYTNTAALTCHTPSFCSSQVLELKGLLARALCAQLVLPSSLLPSPWHPSWNQEGRPRTFLPTPSSAGAQDEGVREKDLAPTTHPQRLRDREVASCPPGCRESPLSSRSCARGEGLGLSICLLFSWDYTKEGNCWSYGRSMINVWATVQLF